MNITNDTPVTFLTVGQLKEVLFGTGIVNNKPDPDTLPKAKNYVYGLRGIRQLFNVSHPTAQKLKDGIIKDAISQHGRKIIVDADLAMELFKNSKNLRR